MHDFKYVEGELFCEEMRVEEIAPKVGTPFYLYSSKTLVDHYRKLDKAFSSLPHLVCYSLKANSNLAMCKLLAQEGAGADVVSSGELFKALKAGMPAQRIVFAGVGKTEEEIEYALKAQILMLNVESVPELDLINEVAGRLGKKAQVSLRVNPDVDPQTHAYVATGRKENKFGLSMEVARELFERRAEFTHLKMVGVHAHIGSQITSVRPYVEALQKIVVFIKDLERGGIKLEYLNVGGGMGIVYETEIPSTADEFAKALLPLIKQVKAKIILEPGRFIVGNAGILVTMVLYVKKTAVKTFIIVDAGMSDLIRPSLYGAYHEIRPTSDRKGTMPESDKKLIVADIVGPICESGDFFARDREIPEVEGGQLLAIFGAGAYGFSMSSNYNCRPRPPEVLVKGDKFQVIREREKYEDLIRGEV